MTISHVSTHWFNTQLLKWYAQHGRHSLPWKKRRCAYRVWVSEIMLQQTQVTTVIPYFERFMKFFPSVQKLAQAPLDHVLHYWSGLGYYARARNLHNTAQIVVQDHQGRFPRQLEHLNALPGIGRSTAGAILAQAFEIPAPILDANVRRVFTRFHRIGGHFSERRIANHLWQLAEFYTPNKQVSHFTQAIMDLGAICCTARQPRCSACPVQAKCLAYQQNEQHLFPGKKPKKALPTRQVHLLCLLNAQDEILLQQRPKQGIWGGLWSLPEYSNFDHIQQFLKKITRRAVTVQSLPQIAHRFTHFHLEIFPFLARLDPSPPIPELEWISKKRLGHCGLPAPIKKLIYSFLTIS